jgi:RNA:NAD 2'-phosphotransferase (TPT1/KptA family)
MKKTRVSYGKFLSLVLRHKPETIGLNLDPQG